MIRDPGRAESLQVEIKVEGLAAVSVHGEKRQRAASLALFWWMILASFKPEVFLFDEPLSNLDAKLRVQMRVELAKLTPISARR